MIRDQMAGVPLDGDSASSTWKHLDLNTDPVTVYYIIVHIGFDRYL